MLSLLLFLNPLPWVDMCGKSNMCLQIPELLVSTPYSEKGASLICVGIGQNPIERNLNEG
jgi:hypothetical protein